MQTSLSRTHRRLSARELLASDVPSQAAVDRLGSRALRSREVRTDRKRKAWRTAVAR